VLRQFVALKIEKVSFPIVLYRMSDDAYSALYLKCTHQGCEVRPNDQLLACPCHGSEFDRQGKVLEGPAEKPLKKFPVETDAENIYITLI
jgi:cytochrome b6-f complex iron-sulfur subunit